MKKYDMHNPDVFKFDKQIDVQPVTVWRSFEYGFNHWQEGHVEGTKPIPNCKYQEGKWKNLAWGKRFTYALGYTFKLNPIFPNTIGWKILLET